MFQKYSVLFSNQYMHYSIRYEKMTFLHPTPKYLNSVHVRNPRFSHVNTKNACFREGVSSAFGGGCGGTPLWGWVGGLAGHGWWGWRREAEGGGMPVYFFIFSGQWSGLAKLGQAKATRLAIWLSLPYHDGLPCRRACLAIGLALPYALPCHTPCHTACLAIGLPLP